MCSRRTAIHRLETVRSLVGGIRFEYRHDFDVFGEKRRSSHSTLPHLGVAAAAGWSFGRYWTKGWGRCNPGRYANARPA